jgi:hypothetical protein
VNIVDPLLQGQRLVVIPAKAGIQSPSSPILFLDYRVKPDNDKRIYTQGISTCNLAGSKHSGRKRRFASRHIQDAECFRIPKNPKIFVSAAVEMHYYKTNRVEIITLL